MKLQLHEKVVFRVPQFPVDATLEECWEELKASIALASTEFYQYIKDTDYSDYANLPEGIRITVQKYFNRARFRATPYGTFAGFGVCGFAPDKKGITIAPETIGHRFTDWTFISEAKAKWLSVPDDRLSVFANSSHYLTGDSIRYITEADGKFSLTDIDADEQIIAILKACAAPIRLTALAEKLAVETSLLRGWVEELVEAQLLLTDYHPNIIGEDYFKRTGSVSGADRQPYLITERIHLSGGLDGKTYHRLTQAIPLLLSISPAPETPENLGAFIRRFTARYEGMEVPLLQALDPETGIGYGQLEAAASTNALVEELAPMRLKEQHSRNELPLTDFLAKQLTLLPNGSAVDLDGFVAELPDSTFRLPNTFSAVITECDGTLTVEQLGGHSATALQGRFSITEGAIDALCREHARFEQSANPDVLFFDVGYTAEGYVDNINRRNAVYDHQLAILNYDLTERPLCLNDIHAKVDGDGLVLFSKRLNKRLVPRMATAYNHTRSDLSVFRLLCDLQQQHLRTHVGFAIEKRFPGLQRYPEVRYRNIILSAAKWKLSLPDGPGTTLTAFRQYIQNTKTSDRIKVGLFDQTLCLDLERDEDVYLLFTILQKRGELWATEYRKPTACPIHDANGRPYTGEFVLSFRHGEPLYPGIVRENKGNTTVQRLFPPGSEWLYWEIHCHPMQADGLLHEELSLFIRTNGTAIREWFFIRYNEGGDHIRFRAKLDDPRSSGILLAKLNCLLKGKMESGIVSDIRVRCYHRELERYGADLMDAVERHFHTDSGSVLELLHYGIADDEKYAHCVGLLQGIRRSDVIDRVAFDRVINQALQGFNAEHAMKGSAFKVLNGAYAAFRRQRPMGPAHPPPSGALFRSFHDTLAACAADRRGRLLTDLFHMHVNRLFSTHQRTHELVIYNYFMKGVAGAEAKAHSLPALPRPSLGDF